MNRVYELRTASDLSECSVENAIEDLRADPLILCVSKSEEWRGRSLAKRYTLNFEIDNGLQTDAWYVRQGDTAVFSGGSCGGQEEAKSIRKYLESRS